jgi:hypothetical protein
MLLHGRQFFAAGGAGNQVSGELSGQARRVRARQVILDVIFDRLVHLNFPQIVTATVMRI